MPKLGQVSYFAIKIDQNDKIRIGFQSVLFLNINLSVSKSLQYGVVILIHYKLIKALIFQNTNRLCFGIIFGIER